MMIVDQWCKDILEHNMPTFIAIKAYEVLCSMNGLAKVRALIDKLKDNKEPSDLMLDSFETNVIETKDFVEFKIITLNGKAVQNKGMALFPRKIKGKYVPANSTDIAIIPWKDALMSLVVEEGKTFSSAFFIYSLSCKGNIDLLKSLAYSYIERRGESYYAYLNLQDKCIKIFFGQRMENVLARNVDFIIPIAIVIFNVLMSMYSIVNERKREIYIFNAIGFNPVHIALLFLAESVVYGLLAGGIGYMAGLVTFRAMSVFARTLNLIVREKLEWYWSIIAILISIGVAMIAAFKPALNAAMMYTPSKVVRVKVAEKEREKREEKILKTYAGKTYPLRLKVKEEEAIIFFSYLYTRLSDLQSGYRERVENLVEEEEEEYPDGRLIKRFKFNYVFVTEEGKRLVTENELRCTKHPKEKLLAYSCGNKQADTRTETPFLTNFVHIENC